VSRRPRRAGSGEARAAGGERRPTARTGRVGDLLRAELADLVQREVHDPRIKHASLVGFVGVDVSPDLRRAVIKVSTLGSEEERLAAVAALEHARGFLRSELARRLRLRVTPELHFELDRGAEHSQTIADLLESLHARDESS
jgi:ribosome-binding factor A